MNGIYLRSYFRTYYRVCCSEDQTLGPKERPKRHFNCSRRQKDQAEVLGILNQSQSYITTVPALNGHRQ